MSGGGVSGSGDNGISKGNKCDDSNTGNGVRTRIDTG